MKRKDFIRRSALAGFSFTLLHGAGIGPVVKPCSPTDDETEGPFPTHEPATLQAKNIISDRSGLPLTITISISNINNKCAGLKDAIVDIWHCDSKGEYSEYGGKSEFGQHGPDNRRGPGMPPPPPGGQHPMRDSLHPHDKNMPPPPMGGMGSMQAADHTKEHFLRGRQVTGKGGVVSFQSIYPGWYPGRAPHVHVHIYDKSNRSLLITQIAFPEAISKEVYAQGVYALHGQPETTNANDNVFNDSIANELGTLTGNLKDGFILSHAIYVKA